MEFCSLCGIFGDHRFSVSGGQTSTAPAFRRSRFDRGQSNGRKSGRCRQLTRHDYTKVCKFYDARLPVQRMRQIGMWVAIGRQFSVSAYEYRSISYTLLEVYFRILIRDGLAEMASGTALKPTGHAINSSPTSDEWKLHAGGWLLCRTGSHAFALPISDVVETLRVLPIERLAEAPPFVRGLCLIRGVAVVILDTGVLFGDQALTYRRIVTARVGGRTIGFLAETVVGIRAIPADALARLPPLLSEIQAIGTIANLDDELVFFLQTARAISEDFLVSIDTRKS